MKIDRNLYAFVAVDGNLSILNVSEPNVYKPPYIISTLNLDARYCSITMMEIQG